MWDRAEKGMCLLLSRKMGSGSRAPLLLVGRLFPAASGCHMSSGGGHGAPDGTGSPFRRKGDLSCSGSSPGPADMLGGLWDGVLRWWSRYEKRQQKSGAVLSRPRPLLCTQIATSTRPGSCFRGCARARVPSHVRAY